MKGKQLLCAAMLLALPLVSWGQERISEVFESIRKADGYRKSETNIHSEKDSVQEETKIVDFLLDQGLWGLFDRIREAFEKDRGKSYFEWSCYDPMSSTNTRAIWRIQRGLGDDVIVGEEKNSSFVIMCFEDAKRKDCRTVFSAEWWKAEDPNYKRGRFVYSYGKKPEAQTAPSSAIHYEGRLIPHVDADSILRKYSATMKYFDDKGNLKVISDSIRELLPRTNMAEGVFSTFPDDSYFFGSDADVPLNGSGRDWTQKAIKRMGKLNASEWLRLFGLLTEQIANYTDKDNRDLIVAAGLVLDLCKNVPSKLNLEERELCVGRLQKIHSSIKHDYVRDILSLSIQKLEP